MMDLLKEDHLLELNEVNKELEDLTSKSTKLNKLKKNEAFPDRDKALTSHME